MRLAVKWLSPRLLVTALGLAVTLGLGGCTDEVDEQQLGGPSDLGRSVQMQAFPDVVNADGVSQSVIEMTLRDQNGAPISGQAVEFWFSGDGILSPSPDSTFVGPIQSSLIMATDDRGVARVIYTAGTRIGRVVTVFVRSYGIDTNRAFYRTIEIYQQ
jgi:hypothetical protein